MIILLLYTSDVDDSPPDALIEAIHIFPSMDAFDVSIIREKGSLETIKRKLDHIIKITFVEGSYFVI